MLLLIDMLAVVILGTVEVVLFPLGQVTVVPGFVGGFAAGDVGIALFVVRGLGLRHGAVLQAIVDAILLVFQAIVHFVDARMVGNIGLRKHGAGCHRCTDDQAEQNEFRLCIHGKFLGMF